MERKERRPANAREVEYVLSLASFAVHIETDEVSLYWSEEGIAAEFSTQNPFGIFAETDLWLKFCEANSEGNIDAMKEIYSRMSGQDKVFAWRWF